MPKVADRVEETTSTTGTGTLTLAGAVAGYQAFSSGFSDGDTLFYAIEGVDTNGVPTGDWEVGIGTYTLSGTTLSRDIILASSNGGSVVSLSSPTSRVFSTEPAVEIRRNLSSYFDLMMGAL
jgi:hypothetical protein